MTCRFLLLLPARFPGSSYRVRELERKEEPWLKGLREDIRVTPSPTLSAGATHSRALIAAGDSPLPEGFHPIAEHFKLSASTIPLTSVLAEDNDDKDDAHDSEGGRACQRDRLGGYEDDQKKDDDGDGVATSVGHGVQRTVASGSANEDIASDSDGDMSVGSGTADEGHFHRRRALQSVVDAHSMSHPGASDDFQRQQQDNRRHHRDQHQHRASTSTVDSVVEDIASDGQSQPLSEVDSNRRAVSVPVGTSSRDHGWAPSTHGQCSSQAARRPSGASDDRGVSVSRPSFTAQRGLDLAAAAAAAAATATAAAAAAVGRGGGEGSSGVVVGSSNVVVGSSDVVGSSVTSVSETTVASTVSTATAQSNGASVADGASTVDVITVPAPQVVDALARSVPRR
jgi:hypothetical protein